jgi:hypothetical protein
MTAYLLDSNVLSETTKEQPHPGVIRFLCQQDDFWLSAVALYELEYGLQLLPPGARRSRLRAAQSSIVAMYAARIVPLDRVAAEWAAELRAHARHAGRAVDVGDALIAGTAKAHGLAIATRNVRDFEGMDIDVVNPWDYS